MSNINLFDAIEKLSFEDLLEVERFVRCRKKEFKPFRIKRKFKRCGKQGCSCMAGPADNEWGNLHGPYLFAQWRENGKTKSVSLGKNDGQLVSYPLWSDYFKITPSEYEAMSSSKRSKLWSITLTDAQFEDFHGVKRSDDKLDRYGRFYGTQANHDAYWAAYDLVRDQRQAASSSWSRFGVVSVTGVKILDDLVRRGYYLREG